MYKGASRHQRRVENAVSAFEAGLFRSNQPVPPGPPTLDDDALAGPPRPGSYWTEVEDSPTESLEDHILVREYGFTAAALTGSNGSPLQDHDLDTLVVACSAARKLGRQTTAQILGTDGPVVPRLLRAATALHAAAFCRG